MRRKDFITKSALFVLGTMLWSKGLLAKRYARNAGTFTFHEGAIIDLHCHPSLKMYLLDKKFWKRHLLRSPGENIVHMQEDVHEFSYGNVRGILATHYLVEGGIEKEWGTVKFLWPLIKKIAFATADKIEHEDYSNFTQINTMIDTLENQLHVANEKLDEQKKPLRFVVARDFYEFRDALSTAEHPKNTIPVINTIEGAHALGRNLVRSEKKLKEKNKMANDKTLNLSPFTLNKTAVLPGEGKMILPGRKPGELYIRNLKALHARGVALITLSHFFANDISFPVEGISPEGKKIPGMTWTYDSSNNFPLTDIGRAVVRCMLEIGVIVDLTHSTPAVRQDVFRIRDEVNAEREKAGQVPRPVVFTHVGSREVFDEHDGHTYPDYGFYDVDQDEITKVCAFDGVMGVIPENFWLTGSNGSPAIPGVADFNPKLGIPYMIETMKKLNAMTPRKDYDNIAVGTDFDGLATNPKDLYLNRQLADLYTAMKADPEISLGDRFAKITYKNALRLLENGWGEGPVKPSSA